MGMNSAIAPVGTPPSALAQTYRGVLVLIAAVAVSMGSAAPARAESFPIQLTWSGPPSAHVNDSFGWSVTATNRGSTAREVYLEETGGNRETVTSAIPSQGTCQVELTVRRCTLGSIEPNASAIVVFTSSVSGLQAFRASVAAMPTSTGGMSTFASYPVVLIAQEDPLLTDVRLSLTGPEEIPSQTLGTYSVTLRNHDSTAASGVVLLGQVSNADRLVRANVDGRTCGRLKDWSQPIAECVVGELAPGASAQMRVQVLPTSDSSFIDVSVRQSWKDATVLRQNELATGARIGPSPVIPPGPEGGAGKDLELTVTHSGDPVPAGTQFTWTDTIVNRGSAATGPLRLGVGADGLRTIVEHTRAECSETVVSTYCDLPSLPPGGTASLTFTGFAFDPNGGPAVFTDLVSDGSSRATVNSVRGTFDPTAPPVDLAIEPVAQHAIAPTDSTPAVGATNANSVTTWRVTNRSSSRARHVLVTDRVQPLTTSHTGYPGCAPSWCVLEVLDPAASAIVSFTTAGPDATVQHTVRVVHAGPDPVEDNDTASATAPARIGGGSGSGGSGGTSVPDLQVEVTASSVTVPPNGTVDLAVLVRNRGTAGALQTRLVVDLPASASLLGPPAYDRGSGCNGQQRLDCFLDYLPSGGTTRVLFSIRVGGSGAQAVAASVSADRDANSADNTAALTLTIAAAPTARVAASGAPARTTMRGNAAANRLIGTARGELIRGLAGNDRLFGRGGNDVIFGGAGNDLIDGGLGLDRLFGGAGGDTIRARDGKRDAVDCGPGRDRAIVDRTDILRGCETVLRR